MTNRLNIISESGLYALVIRSNKPEAREFRKWVTAEVLPSIRKTGAYIAPNLGIEQLAALAKKIGDCVALITMEGVRGKCVSLSYFAACRC